MRMYPLLSLIGLLFLLGSCATKKKYKALKAEHQQTELVLDSTRYQLAEALRAWQKIRDKSSMTTGELQDLSKTLEDKNQRLQNQLNVTQSEKSKVQKELKQTQEALELLQKEWGGIAEKQAVLESRVERIQIEVRDSLSDWDSLGLEVLRVKELLHLEISDQILFNKGYYVNNDGRKFLEKLAPLLQKYEGSYRIVIRAVVLPQKGINPIDASLKRGLNVAKMLKDVGYNGKELNVLGMGLWKKTVAGKLPAVGIDFIPLENPAYRDF